jgi:hypothetical protein
MLNTYADLINGGILPAYADYALWDLPPGDATSTLYAFGREGSRVYAGEPVTATIYADNLGASPNLTTTGPITFYIGVEIPDNTTYVPGSATNGAALSEDLSLVSAGFPAQPGIYWTGSVTDTRLFDTSFMAGAGLVTGDTITVTVHYADGSGTDQYFTDTAQVTIVSAFGLSAMEAGIDPVFPGKVAEFTAVAINKSENAKEIQLVAPVPTDTTFITATGASTVVAGSNVVTVTQVVSPYAGAGPTEITFQWQLGPSYDFGDTITSDVVLSDVLTGETFPLSATANVDAIYQAYLPTVWTIGSYAVRGNVALP